MFWRSQVNIPEGWLSSVDPDYQKWKVKVTVTSNLVSTIFQKKSHRFLLDFAFGFESEMVKFWFSKVAEMLCVDYLPNHYYTLYFVMPCEGVLSLPSGSFSLFLFFLLFSVSTALLLNFDISMILLYYNNYSEYGFNLSHTSVIIRNTLCFFVFS